MIVMKEVKELDKEVFYKDIVNIEFVNNVIKNIK